MNEPQPPELIEEHLSCTKAGSDYVSREASAHAGIGGTSPRVIAFYLPQYHAIPENDLWWGRGFTEWVNVTRGIPKFRGHYQPRLPADLGYYDLANPCVLHQQIEVARKFGVSAFCFHHYWFSGKRLLETPLNNFLKDRELNFPFLVNWANENWTRTWDGQEKEVLISQQYSPEDDANLAEHLAELTSDFRYFRVDGRPLVMIYKPSAMPSPRKTVDCIRNKFSNNGLPNPFLVMARAFNERDPGRFGLDGSVQFPPHNIDPSRARINNQLHIYQSTFAGTVIPYASLVAQTLTDARSEYPLFPGVSPSWDNDARRPGRGLTVYGSSPRMFRYWMEQALIRSTELARTSEQRIVFVNAWNEWGEGAYLEPDMHFGYAYLDSLARALNTITTGETPLGHGVLSTDLRSSNLRSKARSQLTRLINKAGRELIGLGRRLANY